MADPTSCPDASKPVPSPACPEPKRRGGYVLIDIAVGRVDPDPGQPRVEFEPDALDRLGRSLTDHGQIQPITVRLGREPGRFTIVTGERRWRAAVNAGLPTVSAVVLGAPMSDGRRLEVQLVENAIREDLSPIEQARAYRLLMTLNGWKGRRLAEMLHLHPTTVTRALGLLDLPESVQNDVESGALSPSVAFEIGKLGDPERQQSLATRAVSEKLSRSEVAGAIAPRKRTPRADAPAPAFRRVFPTSTGRVTVVLDRDGTSRDVTDAILEVAEVLKSEMRSTNY